MANTPYDYNSNQPMVESDGTPTQVFRTWMLKLSSAVYTPSEAYTVATLPAGTVGQMARITDGDAGLAWGATAINSGSSATPYLVWYNGTAWAVIGA